MSKPEPTTKEIKVDRNFLLSETSRLEQELYELRKKHQALLKRNRELEASNKRLDDFLKTTYELVCFLDHEGRIVAASDSFVTAFRLTGRDYNGKTCLEISQISPFHSSIFKRAERLNQKAWAEGKALTHEEILTLPGGEDRLFDLVRTPIFCGGGSHAGMVIVGLDVTSRVRREFESQIHMAEQNAIFENALIGIAYTREGLIVRVNRTIENMLGYGRDHLEGTPMKEYFPKNIFDAVLQKAKSNFDHGRFYTEDLQLSRRSGTRFWCRLVGKPIESESMFHGTIWLLDDIDEEKKAEQLKEDIERVVRHDLKSPLQAIIGAADLIAEESGSEMAETWAGMILSSGEKMLKMIERSLDMFKMEEGEYFLCPEQFDIMDIFHSLRDEFSSITRAKKLDLKFQLDGAPMPGDFSMNVSAEKDNLENLFANLIKNALEAAPMDSDVFVNMINDDAEVFKVDIHNQGEIPDEVKDRFFDRYATSGKVGGTGLGTYSAKLIAAAHGGDVSFETGPDTGTTLRVRIPQTGPAPACKLTPLG